MNSWHFDGHGINDSEGRRILKSTVPQYGPEGGNNTADFERVSVLAAAAPDLLAALERVAAWEADPDRYAGDLADIAQDARAAIAKARGES